MLTTTMTALHWTHFSSIPLLGHHHSAGKFYHQLGLYSKGVIGHRFVLSTACNLLTKLKLIFRGVTYLRLRHHQDRLAYIENVFEGSGDRVTPRKCDDSRLASHVRKLAQYLATISGKSEEVVEINEEGPDGAVYSAMMTMELKHKSAGATQEEARSIRSKVLADDGVVVLNLMDNDDA
jgi:hypothetical protein